MGNYFPARNSNPLTLIGPSVGFDEVIVIGGFSCHGLSIYQTSIADYLKGRGTVWEINGFNDVDANIGNVLRRGDNKS